MKSHNLLGKRKIKTTNPVHEILAMIQTMATIFFCKDPMIPSLCSHQATWILAKIEETEEIKHLEIYKSLSNIAKPGFIIYECEQRLSIVVNKHV